MWQRRTIDDTCAFTAVTMRNNTLYAVAIERTYFPARIYVYE
jgi:hypothetical protein